MYPSFLGPSSSDIKLTKYFTRLTVLNYSKSNFQTSQKQLCHITEYLSASISAPKTTTTTTSMTTATTISAVVNSGKQPLNLILFSNLCLISGELDQFTINY